MKDTKELKELLEILAALEHDQWVLWTKEISKRFKTELSFQYQIEQWSKSWIPYEQLTEGQKEMDRVFARKVIDAMESFTDKLLQEEREKGFSR